MPGVSSSSPIPLPLPPSMLYPMEQLTNYISRQARRNPVPITTLPSGSIFAIFASVRLQAVPQSPIQREAAAPSKNTQGQRRDMTYAETHVSLSRLLEH